MLSRRINESFNFLARHSQRHISAQTLSFNSAVLSSQHNWNQIKLQQQIKTEYSCRHLTTSRKRSRKVSATLLDSRFKMEWPKITLFGDSITRRSMDPDNGCWGSMIAHQVGNFLEVNVRGFEGYTTEWSLELMPQLFPKSYLDKVEIFIPFFGHNDAWENFPTSVSPVRYESNMRAMIKYLNDNGIENRKIVLITPTWYHAEDFVKYMESLGFPPVKKEFEHAKKYADIIERLGRETGIDVVDFFKISANYKPLEAMFCDGIHYSREGARLLFDCLMPVIERKLETSFKKPLADMWHVAPFEKQPSVAAVIAAHIESQKSK